VVFSRFVGPFCVHPKSAGEFMFSPFVDLRRPYVEEFFIIIGRGLFFLRMSLPLSCALYHAIACRHLGWWTRPAAAKTETMGYEVVLSTFVILGGFNGFYDISRRLYVVVVLSRYPIDSSVVYGLVGQFLVYEYS